MSYNLIQCNCGCTYAEADGHNCNKFSDAYRIEELEAKLAKAVRSLTVIDALDPEGFVNRYSQSALVGLVLRMGEVARTTLAELKGQNDE